MFKVISPKSCKESAAALEGTLNNLYDKPSKEIRINWGCSSFNDPKNSNVLGNSTTAIKNSVSKRTTFKLLAGFTVPVLKSSAEYTDTTILHTDESGHGGKGVRLVHPDFNDWNPDYLYTKFITGDEYRVYFAYGKPIGYAQKVKLDPQTPEKKIKTSVTGYGYQMIIGHSLENLFNIFADGVDVVSKKLGLKYGAVDYILEDGTNHVYILETNSAPCLFDTDLMADLAAAIIENEVK